MAMEVLSKIKKKKRYSNTLEVLQIQRFFLDKSIYGTNFETKEIMQLTVDYGQVGLGGGILCPVSFSEDAFFKRLHVLYYNKIKALRHEELVYIDKYQLGYWEFEASHCKLDV